MRAYVTPLAEKLEFCYADMITASSCEPSVHHGDVGVGLGHGGGCDHNPGHGNPHKPHPGKP